MNSGRGPGDLVLGLTLAEVFLLLLFVVWLGVVGEDGAGATPTVSAAELAARLAKVESSLADEERRRREAEKQAEDFRIRLEMVRRMVGGTGISEDEIKAGVERFAETIRRGSPRCDTRNTLVHVVVDGGAVDLEIVGSSEVLSPIVDATTVRRLTGRGEIARLLQQVNRYYAIRRAEQRECRFDYRLTYTTAEDYLFARSYFEAYFYPEMIRKKAP